MIVVLFFGVVSYRQVECGGFLRGSLQVAALAAAGDGISQPRS